MADDGTPENERIYWGVRLEAAILEAAKERFDYEVEQRDERLTNGKGLGGHPDAIATCPERGRGIIEIKTADWLVRNHGKASLRVAVNGVFVGDVAADHEQAFLVAPGEIYVALDDSDGREVRWSGRLAPGQSLPMPEAVVEAPRLLIENDTTTELTVRIDERGEWRKLSVGAKLEIDDLPEGEHLIELNAAGTALRRRVRLRSGAPVYRVTPSLPQSPQPVSDSATK